MESRIKELEAEVRHYRFACLGMEKEIAGYRLAEKERNELELAEIQETEKLHKENEELKKIICLNAEDTRAMDWIKEFPLVFKADQQFRNDCIETLEVEKEKLKEENLYLRDENKTYDKQIVDQERELQELRVKNTSIHTLESCNHQQKLRIEELEEENDVLQKFIAGNLDCVAEVKTLISRDWTKEFIANNQERWEEVGLEFDEEDFE